MGRLLDTTALENLVAVARAGSISAAARALGQPKQSLSRRIGVLESQLGVRLFDRTTRALNLTSEGRVLCDRAERILGDLKETQQLIAGRAREPEGPLRISAPHLFGTTRLSGVIAEFCLRYPKVQLDFDLTDRPVDLVEEGVDAAIRVGAVLDQSLIARLLTRSELVLVASPAYLARNGIPEKPADLQRHAAVLAPMRDETGDWLLERAGERIMASIPKRCRVGSIALAADLAAAGVGIARSPMLLVADALAQGALVRILPDWRPGASKVHIVHPSQRLVAPRLRAFIDLLADGFASERRLATASRP